MALTFGTLDFAVAFNRQTAFPLDAKSYFESLELATAAAASAEEAGSSDTTYYYGQTVAVVEGSKATLYVIQPDKTLKEVGGNIVINENVFVKGTDGALDLLGFADAVAGAQLVKSADGKVSWVKPDTTTVEGLSTAVSALQETVGDDTKGLVKQVADNTGAIAKLNGASTEEGSVAYQIAQIIDGAPEAYDTLKEIADWITDHPEDTSAMNTQITTNKNDIAALKTQVGTEPVADQISGAITTAKNELTTEIGDKVDKITPEFDSVLVYTVTKSGETITQGSLVVGTVAGALARYDDQGRLGANSPSADDDVANKRYVDNYVDSAITAAQPTNKTVLDAITASKVEAWDGAVTDSHTHSNKTILDAITQEKIDAWDAKLSTVPVDGVSVELNSENKVAVKAVNVNKLTQSDGEELILNGGSAN